MPKMLVLLHNSVNFVVAKMKTMIITPKVFLVGLCFLVAPSVYGQGIGNVMFGASYEDAIVRIVDNFGTPTQATEDEVTYSDAWFEGFLWNRVYFKFKEGRLCEARFYRNHKTKLGAKTELKSIAEKFGAKHELSIDYEEDGNNFYAGGTSPVGIGRLFTIFMAPYKGQWSDQVRFGPFKFKDKEL